MGFRFRKSFKVGPMRVNFSKSGMGYSFGTKGARITKMANGRTRRTVGIPGTGISYVSESKHRRKRKQEPAQMGFFTALFYLFFFLPMKYLFYYPIKYTILLFVWVVRWARSKLYPSPKTNRQNVNQAHMKTYM